MRGEQWRNIPLQCKPRGVHGNGNGSSFELPMEMGIAYFIGEKIQFPQ